MTAFFGIDFGTTNSTAMKLMGVSFINTETKQVNHLRHDTPAEGILL